MQRVHYKIFFTALLDHSIEVQDLYFFIIHI